MHRYALALTLSLALMGCSKGQEARADNNAADVSKPRITLVDGPPFASNGFGEFKEPWAMTFLPGGRLLVTERAGALKLFSPANRTTIDVTGMPKVAYGGQGGLGDVVLGPDADTTDSVYPIYLSWAEAGEDDVRGAAVGRGELVLDEAGKSAQVRNLKVIWRQVPKVSGNGHFSHRLAFSPDGQYLFISSGERQKFDPAQDMSVNLGKIVRLLPDGAIPPDNPFADKGGVTAQIWSLGHRNILGLAFDADGRLWEHEMGPKGGDEVNLIKEGLNYGYPIVSNGDHYDGKPIPDHDTHPEFEAPKVSWNPVISPAGAIIYSGKLFPDWKGSMFIGGLSSEALIRVALDGESARKADQWDMGARIREVEQGPDGAIWLLEDGKSGKLRKLTPP
ncbi:MAG TPA: PQQ-dependent sugar dehydrogenase [Rhizorhapis sp.]